MKYLVMYLAMMYIVWCADDCDSTDKHTKEQRLVRAAFWPLTVTEFFRTQSMRLHRLLNILWCVLIMGWFLTLLYDRV